MKKIEVLIKLVNDIFKNYEKIKVAFLFGSYARGEALESSDLDIAIYSDYDIYELSEIEDELKNKLNMDIDLVDISKVRYEIQEDILILNNIIYIKSEDDFWQWFDYSKLIIDRIHYCKLSEQYRYGN